MSSIHLQAPNRYNGQRIDKSAAFEEKRQIISGKPGVLNNIYAVNKSASKVYLYVCDMLTGGTPAIGNTLIPPLVLNATDGSVSIDHIYGYPFTNGLFLAASSTLATYTATTTADLNWIVAYAMNAETPTNDA